MNLSIQSELINELTIETIHYELEKFKLDLNYKIFDENHRLQRKRLKKTHKRKTEEQICMLFFPFFQKKNSLIVYCYTHQNLAP